MRRGSALAPSLVPLLVAQGCAVVQWELDNRSVRPPARAMSAYAWHSLDMALYITGGTDMQYKYSMGQSPYKYYSDTWRYTLVEGWSSRAAFPSPRRLHTLVCMLDACYLFGGVRISYTDFPFGEQVAYFADLWMYSTTNDSWTQLQADASALNGPSARCDHAAVAVDNRYMYIHSWHNGGDLFRYDRDEGTWSNMTPSGRKSRASSTAGVYLPETRTLFFMLANLMYLYDIDADSWSTVEPVDGSYPGYHVAGLVYWMQKVWMLGAVSECESQNRLFMLAQVSSRSWMIQEVETEAFHRPQTTNGDVVATEDGQLIVFGGLIDCPDQDFAETYDATLALELSALFSSNTGDDTTPNMSSFAARKSLRQHARKAGRNSSHTTSSMDAYMFSSLTSSSSPTIVSNSSYDNSMEAHHDESYVDEYEAAVDDKDTEAPLLATTLELFAPRVCLIMVMLSGVALLWLCRRDSHCLRRQVAEEKRKPSEQESADLLPPGDSSGMPGAVADEHTDCCNFEIVVSV